MLEYEIDKRINLIGSKHSGRDKQNYGGRTVHLGFPFVFSSEMTLDAVLYKENQTTDGKAFITMDSVIILLNLHISWLCPRDCQTGA